MYTFLLFLHFIGLALGVGTGFANLTLGLATRDMAPPERFAFMLRASVLAKNGSIGITLLIASGIGMALVRGFSETRAWGGVAFDVKLALVVVLAASLGRIQMLAVRAKREGGGPAMAQIPMVGGVMLLTGVLVVVCAVLAFH